MINSSTRLRLDLQKTEKKTAMKIKILSFIMIGLMLPFFALAEIPGQYKMIVPHIPPQAGSLDKVNLAEVFAFDCGHCYNFNRDTLPKLKKKFGKKLVVSPKPIGWRGHDPGRLYFIAEKQGKGDKVMMMIFDLIFEKGLGKQMFSRDKLQFVARAHGLTDAYKAGMDSPEIVQKMNASVQYAQQRNINSTPTLIIEDVMIVDRNFSNLVTVINALLKEPVK